MQEIDDELVSVLRKIENIEANYQKEKEAKQKEQQARLARQPNRPEFNTSAVSTSTAIRNTNIPTHTGTNQQQLTEAAVTFDPNPVCHLYPLTDPTSREGQYELPVNDSIIRRATQTPTNQIMTDTTNAAGHNEPRRYNNRANTDTQTNPQPHMTNTTGLNGFNISPNSSDQRIGPKCYRCGEIGHMRHNCKAERVYCTICRSPNHDIKACRKYQNNNHSPTNNHIPTGYHPTATPSPLLGTGATATGTTTQGPWFHNNQDPHQPRHNTTTTHTPFNSASPAPSANMTEALTQILAQVTNSKKDEVSKQMMKNIKIFDGTNKAECITWLSQVEAAAKFSSSSFHKLICHSMAPSMLHVLSGLSTFASDKDVKDVILANFSDISSTTEVSARLQSLQITLNEPLVTFNSRYESIH